MKKDNEYTERAKRFEEGKAVIITGDTHKEALANLLEEVKKRSKTFDKER